MQFTLNAIFIKMTAIFSIGYATEMANLEDCLLHQEMLFTIDIPPEEFTPWTRCVVGLVFGVWHAHFMTYVGHSVSTHPLHCTEVWW